MKNLCVFCGSSPGANGAYVQAARTFGALLANSNITLIYGGGNVGLMGQLADSVLKSGGEAIGIIPEMLFQKEVAHRNLTKLHVVENMHVRKALMYELSDGFVALPGGTGTLDELFEVFTWIQLGLLVKPIGLLNVDGYFDHLRAFLTHTVEQRFVKSEHLDMLVIDDSQTSLLQRLANAHPISSDKWMERT